MYSKVSNPLTIIAIFAALSEGFASYALINLPHDLQQIFIYFVIAFPSSILIIFFLILVFKHTVLYAPSDFKDESMFLELMNFKNIKSEVKSELITNLAISNNDEPPLTPQQIESVSNKIDKAFSSALDENLSRLIGTREYSVSFVQQAKNNVEASLREQEILGFVKNYSDISSSDLHHKISKELNLNVRTVQFHMGNLIRKGLIKTIGNKYCIVNQD